MKIWSNRIEWYKLVGWSVNYILKLVLRKSLKSENCENLNIIKSITEIAMSLRYKSLHITNNLQWFLVGEIKAGQFKKQRYCHIYHLWSVNMLKPVTSKKWPTIVLETYCHTIDHVRKVRLLFSFQTQCFLQLHDHVNWESPLTPHFQL